MHKKSSHLDKQDHAALWNIAYGSPESSKFWNRLRLDNYEHIKLDRVIEVDSVISKNDYTVNSFGYRSIEFTESPDLLVAGCSQTWGVGLHDRFLWASQLADSLKTSSCVNLSYLGWPTDAIVTNIFRYIEKYGNPKKIALLVPDPFRVVVPSNSDVLVSKITADGPKLKNPISNVEYTWLDSSVANQDRATYSKRPHLIEDVIPLEYSVYTTIKMLQLLITYCKNAEIALLWGSWNSDSRYLFESIALDLDLNIDLSGYISFDCLDSLENLDCHDELRSEAKTLFDYAADYKSDLDKGHLGAHPSLHIALAFAERFSSK